MSAQPDPQGVTPDGKAYGVCASGRSETTALATLQMSDFANYSILQGLKHQEFRDLPAKVRRKLVVLMARLAEKSYRRGANHALEVGCIHNVNKWRYGTLARSVGIDTQRSESVVERLFEQNGELRQVGLEVGLHEK